MLERMNSKAFNYFFLITFSSIAAFFLQQQNLKQINLKREINYSQQEEVARANLQVLKKLPSFGFKHLKADWLFIQFIQYFGDKEAREETGYALIPEYFEAILNNDPRFVHAHLMLSTANSVYTGKPKQTVIFLEKSLTNLSPQIHDDAHFLWSYKGTDEMLFLNQIDAAENSYRMAAQWVKQSNIEKEDKQIIATRYNATANFLAENPDSKRARVGAWANILNNVQDQETQERVIREIRKLGGKVTLTENGRFNIKLPEED